MIKPNKKVFISLLISSVLVGCASSSTQEEMTQVLIGSAFEPFGVRMDTESSPEESSASEFLSESNNPSSSQTDNSDAVISSHHTEIRSTASQQNNVDDVPQHYSESGSYQQESYNEDTLSNDESGSNHYQAQNDGSISPSSGGFSQELQNAIMLGDIDKVKAELRSGADVTATDQHGFTTIQSAAMAHSNGAKIIPLLVQYGADPNQTYNTAKMVPLQFVSNAENAQALIKAGANVNSKDIIQGTPLHHATKPEVAKVLLAAGADPNAKNSLGQTPAEKMRKGITYFTEDSDIHRQLRQQYRDAIEVIENYSAGYTDWNNETYDQSNDSYAASYVDNTSNAAQAVGSLDDTIPQHYSAAGYSAKNTVAGAISTSTPMITSNLSDDTEIDFDSAEQEAEKLEAAQVCPMQEYDWYYTGKDCQNDLAHGKGKAINPFEGMYFEGQIEAGQPVEGTLYRNSKEVFEGKFKEGKPNGEGICFFEGAPEECKYYKGQRIDSLHKQRQEFDRQRRLNNQDRQSNAY